MEYHIAICYPGMDEKVMEGVHEYGFNTFQVTLPSTRFLDQGVRVRAFPGYLFIDTRLNPYIHPVDGMMDILMQGAEYAKVDKQSLLDIQLAVNQMAERSDYEIGRGGPDTGDVFEKYFSGNREMDFFDTPGTVVIENTVNMYKHRKMEQVR